MLGGSDDGGNALPIDGSQEDAAQEDDRGVASDASIDMAPPSVDASIDRAPPVDAGGDATQPPTDAAREASADAPPDTATDTATDASVCATAVTHTGSKAVTYQIDVAHDGMQPNDLLALPLCERWSYDFGEPPAYAVVADGRVFVATAGTTGHVTALDESTGHKLWGPIAIKVTLGWTAAAYDNGQVFVASWDARLRALDAVTGYTNWAIPLPGQYYCTSPPTAVAPEVFVGASESGGTLYSVDETTGNVMWMQSVENGDNSSPAVSNDSFFGELVFVSYAGNQAYGFRESGSQLWHYAGPAEGGGGETVAVYDHEVYTRDSFGDLVLDMASGLQTGKYRSTYIPAFTGTTMLTTVGGVLNAIPLPVGMDGGGAATWTFGSATEPVVIAPIVVGPHVVVGTSQRVVVLSATDGSVVSSAALTGIPSPEGVKIGELAGLTAADGMLFVPSGTRLVAY